MNSAIMEQVAMYMASLPCPPLPLIVNENNDNPSERQYCNSHDFIASLLLNAMACGNNNLNQERKKKQIELTEGLLKNLGNLSVPIDVDKAYTHFSEFTAGYICAFANINVGVTFLPLTDVEIDDVVHKACCSWNRAQSIILREGDHGGAYHQKKYRELLLVHCERFNKKNDEDDNNNNNSCSDDCVCR